ncbi:RND superfamily NFE family efflux transporter inner membrane pump subunit [Oleiphilus messinensis]|uniref:RND superfamily NFE family efflux transporter inner membrane pump subunit n=1 Tax=Oleiphilus messinensis TaxID=141451 RepID=A0A1Y0IHD8_9GAMM|nr:efflux RND transporter permease subunit [Oleiphilus messinensis]ARU58813.1 RND superfamily NFE family efflux transporter inner membrane pump subunit [Oleiphilus messinensis]
MVESTDPSLAPDTRSPSSANPKGGGIAAWSIRHPVGVVMIALAAIVLGTFSLGRLSIDLLPHLIYPEIRVRIIDPGVPASVMEDNVTRQLEEQLAITEDATRVQSETSLGATRVDLTFGYNTDIDQALQDASTRLDRAKRFLPDTINPPVIYKLDPSQIPVAEYVITSRLRDARELRTWADDTFRKWFINLPGVAAAEVGGGLVREVQILPDQQRLAGVGLTLNDLVSVLQNENRDEPAGRFQSEGREISGRITSRFSSLEDLSRVPLMLTDGGTVYMSEVATIIDTHQDERIKIRANGIPGVKVSIQKQPTANTVDVVEKVQQRVLWLKEQGVMPDDIEVINVADQSVYVRQALRNSTTAALSGAFLAMAVVYLFLGNLRRTLIIGSAIPIAIMVTFALMGVGGLTLNIMTLGGLALGVGMLVDNTIVMLENIYRHQLQGESSASAASDAAAEVNSAIVAATSTNLAAVLPFIFVSGLTGLLFRELIITISAAIVASLIIAVTLVPALAARVRTRKTSAFRNGVDAVLGHFQHGYQVSLRWVLRGRWLVLFIFIAGLVWAVGLLMETRQIFLPKLDDGSINVRISSDPGTPIQEMDDRVRQIEALFQSQGDVEMVFSLVGGSIFGRSQRESANSARLAVQLKTLAGRQRSSQQWIDDMKREIGQLEMAGIKVRLYQQGIRGVRTSAGDDDISLRIQGSDLAVLDKLARALVLQVKTVPGLTNISFSSEEENSEMAIVIDRDRATALGLSTEELAEAMQIALEGRIVSGFLDGDREHDIRIRLPRDEVRGLAHLESILLYPQQNNRPPVYLGTVAKIEFVRSPSTIKRDNQMRIVEVSATLDENAALNEVLTDLAELSDQFELPKGYVLYDGGAREALQEANQLTQVLLLLALFLVFVVMAIQYEALLNPVVILLSVPFALSGVALGCYVADLPISMPVWLGVIMLAGIVVNNAIVLVEYIELLRFRGYAKIEAILEAGRLRLRPILMTTLTTSMGMLPLALGWGEGAEMLQPLAITIVAGLTFSMLVSLLLVPIIYDFLHKRDVPNAGESSSC